MHMTENRELYLALARVTADIESSQNNSRLDELSSKVSALRGVTVNIYDNARNQEVIDNSVRYLRLSLSDHH